MEFQVTTLNELTTKITDCFIIATFENQPVTIDPAIVDEFSIEYLKQVIAQGDFNSKIGETLLLPLPSDQQIRRILLIGFGKLPAFDGHQYRKAMLKMATALSAANAANAIALFTPFPLTDSRSESWKLQQLVQAVIESSYEFNQFKTTKNQSQKALTKFTVLTADQLTASQAVKAIEIGQAVAKGTELTRTLGNLPGNICTPSYLAEQALAMASAYPQLAATILEKADMQELGMGAILAVAQGSAQAPKLITLNYQGAVQTVAPIVFVGKGITFDTGGISLKLPPAMDEMKFDMCGGATVLGIIKAVAELKLPLNVIGIVAAAENMPGGTAMKPGDIITSMSGQTIEILNTDAEGRLVLCDALTYSERFKPELVIDIATLTGAMIIALGYLTTGMMSNNDALAEELLNASQVSDDLVWRLPISEDYQEGFSSNFADIPNIPDRPVAGSIMAACFLARFTKNLKWAHLDIAGTAWKPGKEKGATGRPVSLLIQFLLQRCGW